jgi:hypothetical protein
VRVLLVALEAMISSDIVRAAYLGSEGLESTADAALSHID